MNFNELFYRYSTRSPIIINDYVQDSKDEKAALNRLIYTKYSGDLLSNLPSCHCHLLVGEHLKDVVCENCGTPVQSALEHTLELIAWMRSPVGVERFMNPIVWTMLREKFTKSGFEIIRYLCDNHYTPSVKVPTIMEQVQELKIPRGYNNFVKNFDAIMAMLFELKGIKVKKGVVDPLQQLLIEQRDCVFSEYLPLPNRSLLVIEELPVGTYIDPILIGALDAIRTMVGIDAPLSQQSLDQRQRRTVKVIAQLAEFDDDLARNTLAKKEGIFRKHVFGTRSHFSFRAVISSLTDQHDYDELHIPWGIGVSVFYIHLMNKLIRRGRTTNQAKAFLNEHAQKYHPELDELFKILIAESPYLVGDQYPEPDPARPGMFLERPKKHGIPVVFQRNPSLERGSAQTLFVTQVKTATDIPTVSLSIQIVVSYNADFDGRYCCH